MTAFHGGAGGCFPGRANGSCPWFSETFFRDSSLELEKAKPFARSREEIASFAVLDDDDHGEIGSRSPLYSDLTRTDSSRSQSKARAGELGCCGSLSHSGPLPQVAIGDGKIEAGSRLHSCLTRPELCSALVVQAVKIKEELEEEEVATTAAILSPSCSWQAAAYDVAKPMEDLGVVGPTPFLRKTYEMVSDPGTDPVVSWGLSQDSFVVWDRQEFSKQVLPRYFKHSNFSSFIRQLSTYGFRKINPDQWEFANQGFQKGKKHLLKNIKRRRNLNKHRKKSRSTVTSDYQKAEKEAELKMLKKDQEALKTKILKLIEEQDNLQHEIEQVAEQVRHADCRNQHLLLFLIKAAKSPNFILHLTPKKKQKRDLETCESSKKRELLGPNAEATKCLLEAMDHMIQSPKVDCLKISDDLAQMERRPNSVVPEHLGTFQMHNPWPSMDGEDFRVAQGQTPNQMTGASSSDLSSVFQGISEKLLKEDVVIGTDADNIEVEDHLTLNDTGIYLELESLIDGMGTQVN
ncbi:heat stress transcription factor A-2 isoform X1 [Eucalyptus grandis]|uniref:Uncharacterized protein n=2 Tax=Eucalyptus grandis TaxID=71139 RepID=A0ACC3LKP7_EUCGR|nr:heat stress transcription factor A-2 isoform X1 [Eucalyptus grandis]XP_039164829.1 heat stress transcription factor A-2 isoform X1 [Eucalyptus grandis]KAK3438889.1 hypothetical protein EUGRSUZ_C03440 [Eucalyptus grandis]